MYVKKGEYKKAINEYDYALSKDSNNIAAYKYRGIAYYFLGDLDNAMMDLNRVASIDENDSSAYYNLACIYSLKKNSEMAIKSLRKALINGFDNFDNINNDKDLNYVRDTPEFIELIHEFRESCRAKQM